MSYIMSEKISKINELLNNLDDTEFEEWKESVEMSIIADIREECYEDIHNCDEWIHQSYFDDIIDEYEATIKTLKKELEEERIN